MPAGVERGGERGSGLSVGGASLLEQHHVGGDVEKPGKETAVGAGANFGGGADAIDVDGRNLHGHSPYPH